MKNLFLFCAFLLIAFGQCSGQSQGVIVYNGGEGVLGTIYRKRRGNIMKNLFLFCAFLLIAFGQCSGQSQGVIIVGDDNGAVGNEVLQSARTATVVIKMGNPANADAARYVPDFSRAKKQLIGKHSKKLQLVANPADADIVIVAVELNEGENGNTIC